MNIQKEIKKILIINLAFIGDVLLSTAVPRTLREAYPQAVIDMLVIPAVAPIAAAIPYVDHAIIYDKRGQHQTWQGLLMMRKTLGQEQYDMAVCTNFALRGAFLAWLSRIPIRVGYDAQSAAFFLTHVASSKRDESRHEAEKYLAVLQPLALSTENTELALSIPEDSKRVGQIVCKQAAEKPILVFCPYGSYQKKSLADRDNVALIKRLKEKYYCCLIGGTQEAAALSYLQRESLLPDAQVFAGRASLLEIAYLIEQAAVLLTVDTGPMHIAQAVKTPVVALFGPTNPQGWGPRGANDRVFYESIECSPCWGRGRCPEKTCMDHISLEAIEQAIDSIIEVKQ